MPHLRCQWFAIFGKVLRILMQMWICGVFENASWLSFIVLGSELVNKKLNHWWGNDRNISHLSVWMFLPKLLLQPSGSERRAEIAVKLRCEPTVMMWETLHPSLNILSNSVVSQILVHIIIVPINMISSTLSLWTLHVNILEFCSAKAQLSTGCCGGIPSIAQSQHYALWRFPKLLGSQARYGSMSNSPTTVVPRIRSPCGTWIEAQWHGLDSWLEFCGNKWLSNVKPGSKSPPLLHPVLTAPFCVPAMGKSPMSDKGGPSDEPSNLQLQGGPFIYEVFWLCMSNDLTKAATAGQQWRREYAKNDSLLSRSWHCICHNSEAPFFVKQFLISNLQCLFVRLTEGL